MFKYPLAVTIDTNIFDAAKFDLSDNSTLKDVDDNKQLDAFFTEVIQCIDEIEKNCSGNMPVFDDKNFRALFFDYYKQKKNVLNQQS